MHRLLPFIALTACTQGALDVDTDVTADARTLEEAVTVDAMVGHLTALEAIARDHGDTRVSATEGYAQSIAYVTDQLQAAGYTVTLEPYDVVSWDLVDAELVQDGEPMRDWELMPYSGGGRVEAQVIPVDVTLPPGAANSSTSGCEPSDFDGFPTGAIALIQRGSCTFADKAAQATAAGAAAVIIFNEGQSGRRGIVEGVLDERAPGSIPVIGVDFATGEAWATASEPPTLSIDVNVVSEVTVEHNILTELPGARAGNTLLIGAHLDSVAAGPGINDNGSGTAFVLEAALQMRALGMAPERTVRFAWWGAEETGLIGSWHHVFNEDDGTPDLATIGDVDAYLNFDMMASGNGAAFVSDGDGSDIDDGGINRGSAVIEDKLVGWFDGQGKATVPEGLYIPSDSWWFVDLGIPTGHVFSGAFGGKTWDEVSEFGGDQGVDYDPCYHQACDDVSNIHRELYGDLAAAGAHTIQALAMQPEALSDSDSARRRLAPSDRPRPHGCHQHVKWDR